MQLSFVLYYKPFYNFRLLYHLGEYKVFFGHMILMNLM